MQTIISVPEIHCGHCKASIEGSLSKLDGVDTVTVDTEEKTVTVEHSDAVTLETLASEIEAQGYTVPDQA